MSDAVGGARRCSRVSKTRWCFKCKRTVDSGHKFVWVPVNDIGYYRLQHRDCGHPTCYEHSPKRLKIESAKWRRYMGGKLTPEQIELLGGPSLGEATHE